MTKEDLLHSLREGRFVLSASQLKAFAKSPRHWVSYRLKEFKRTDAMKMGTICENLILGEDIQEFIFDPEDRPEKDKGMTSKINKEWKAQLYEQHGEDMVISIDMVEKAKEIAEGVLQNQMVKAMINGGEIQKKLEWEYGGLSFVGYIDYLNGSIIDLKKVSNADFQKVKWQIRDYAMDLQLTMYRIGLAQMEDGNYRDCYLICYDEDSNVTVVKISEDTFSQSHTKYRQLIADFKMCVDNPELFDASYEFQTESGYYLF